MLLIFFLSKKVFSQENKAMEPSKNKLWFFNYDYKNIYSQNLSTFKQKENQISEINCLRKMLSFAKLYMHHLISLSNH